MQGWSLPCQYLIPSRQASKGTSVTSFRMSLLITERGFRCGSLNTFKLKKTFRFKSSGSSGPSAFGSLPGARGPVREPPISACRAVGGGRSWDPLSFQEQLQQRGQGGPRRWGGEATGGVRSWPEPRSPVSGRRQLASPLTCVGTQAAGVPRPGGAALSPLRASRF